MRQQHSCSTGQNVSSLLLILVGIACGFISLFYMDRLYRAGYSDAQALFRVLLLFIALYLTLKLHAALHEAGHLVFGLLTGYRFVSFRVGKWVLLKSGDRLRFCRYTMAGTSGQSLMAPPDMVNGRFPTFLYHMGGALSNLFFAIVFFVIAALLQYKSFWATMLLNAFVVGLAYALINGIPMRTDVIDNDAYNAFSLRRNPDALQAFWLQLRINEQISNGVRLKDMPEEWFQMPNYVAMVNSMVSAQAYFVCIRLIDQHRFEEAATSIRYVLNAHDGLAGMYRSLLKMDWMYCEMLGDNSYDSLSQILSSDQKKAMGAMRKQPIVIRTEYTYALFVHESREEADATMTRFEKAARRYPYPSELEGERELMAIALQKSGL